jgi:hypothetical protein
VCMIWNATSDVYEAGGTVRQRIADERAGS